MPTAKELSDTAERLKKEAASEEEATLEEVPFSPTISGDKKEGGPL